MTKNSKSSSIEIKFKPNFVRQFNKLEEELKSEILEKISLFKKIKNHKTLKVHKLKGKLKNRYSFSVNYKYRIVFIYENKNEAIFLAIGDHQVYKD
jgi:plasmid maintenance system killer protein